MGIPNIYKVLGPGTRISLAKLAVNHLETTGRPLRLAIDTSIWQYQAGKAPGGPNGALRVLYYRILKLMSLSIQLVFVFDGKTPDKRGKRKSHQQGPAVKPVIPGLKRLIRTMGLVYQEAPGEAEAECVMLQREGIVDAVWTTDADAFMFGASYVVRCFSDNGTHKTPTHVDVYRSDEVRERTGLDRQGIILVAMMSGADYDVMGVPGCGPVLACEAARAGFGRDLCRIKEGDAAAYRAWKDRLQLELRTNESKYFSRKHSAIRLPDTFPNTAILKDYASPKVSTKETVERLRRSINWSKEIDADELRFCLSEELGWDNRAGAVHFIRGFAPALLVQRLVQRSTLAATDRESLGTKHGREQDLITVIRNRRTGHESTDFEPELNIAFVPNNIVKLDLSALADPVGEAYISAEDQEEVLGDAEEEAAAPLPSQTPSSPTKRKTAPYDPCAIQRIWILETFVKLGCPLMAETWEEEMRDPIKFITRAARIREAETDAVTQGPKQTRLESHFQASKVKTPTPSSPKKSATLPLHQRQPKTPSTVRVIEVNSFSPLAASAPGTHKTVIDLCNESRSFDAPPTPSPVKTYNSRPAAATKPKALPATKSRPQNPPRVTKRRSPRHSTKTSPVGQALITAHFTQHTKVASSSAPTRAKSQIMSFDGAGEGGADEEPLHSSTSEVFQPDSGNSRTNHRQKKSFVIPRDSLDGCWKSLRPEDLGNVDRSRVLYDVEVLDLTGAA